MRVLVLGATGRVGKLIVEQALARGHAVTALLRDPRKVGDLAGRLLAIEGDALDRNAVERSVEGQDAVIYALGAGNVRQTNLFSASTQILVNAMERHRIRRLIAITGVGAGDTKGHGGFLYDRVIYPLFTRKIYEDKDRQEALIRATALDWVLLRPAPFQEKVPREDLRVALNV
jgi:putative NADH-flavin reductase